MTSPLLVKRLYRSLLRASKPFSSPSPNAAVLSCLLHRTGIDGGRVLAEAFAQDVKAMIEKKEKHAPKSVEEARDLTRAYAEDDDEESTLPPMPWDEQKIPSHLMFRRLLREVVTGVDGFRQMQFISEVDTTRLQNVIRREFRSTTCMFDETCQQEVAFLALRELNKKLRWYESLSKDENLQQQADSTIDRNRRQAAKNVSMLPLDPNCYLKAGTYLVAHPLLTGFFRRTVICILDHTDASNSTRTGGTYGLVVNRVATSESTGKRQTLKDVLRTLPPELMQAFGNCTVREGGPVHMSLQMIHARTPDQPALGGTVLSVEPKDEMTSTALDSDRAVYYQGNMIDAADAVINGALDRDDVSFYVGASCWEVGQLQSEIDRGYFIPCSGPPDMALTGMCERYGDDDDDERNRPRADLWLSMMSALGEEEANLAHLLSHDCDAYSEYGEACDMF